MMEIVTRNSAQIDEEVYITPRAAVEIRRIKAENQIPEYHALRLGVKGGGCSGFTYVLAFDENARPDDMAFDIEGLKVFVDPKSMFYLSGTTLEFSDGLNGRGFVFNNPQAQKTCGCGNSFGV
jgi:iron-sulfur cluster assembly protein